MDWQNAANRSRDDTDNLKATAEEWKHKADGDCKKHQGTEAKLIVSQKNTSCLEAEVEILKRVEAEL